MQNKTKTQPGIASTVRCAIAGTKFKSNRKQKPEVRSQEPGVRKPDRMINLTCDYWRKIREGSRDYGQAAGTRRMPLGPRADLRHHQALHAGRNLRGAGGY